MIADRSYEEIRSFSVEYLGFAPNGPFYTDLDDLRDMLDYYSFGLLRWTPFKSYGSISPISVLEIERSGRYNHWVILVKCGLDMYVLDPSQDIKRERRRDWHRLRPVNYSNITRI